MSMLNWLAYLVAILLSASEVARFWGSARFVPMAFDELLVAAALAFAAWRAPREGACWHIAAWGVFCGFVLVLLVETVDHQLHGPAKASGTFYIVALSSMLLVGLWAIRRAIHLVRDASARSM